MYLRGPKQGRAQAVDGGREEEQALDDMDTGEQDEAVEERAQRHRDAEPLCVCVCVCVCFHNF